VENQSLVTLERGGRWCGTRLIVRERESFEQVNDRTEVPIRSLRLRRHESLPGGNAALREMWALLNVTIRWQARDVGDGQSHD
jgi:hypothetical protein